MWKCQQTDGKIHKELPSGGYIWIKENIVCGFIKGPLQIFYTVKRAHLNGVTTKQFSAKLQKSWNKRKPILPTLLNRL